MNGKTTIPTKAWKTEYAKLTAERKTLSQRYLALKEEVKEAEKIRKSVYGILRQEQREQPHRTQDMERYQTGRRDSQYLPRRPVLSFELAR